MWLSQPPPILPWAIFLFVTTTYGFQSALYACPAPCDGPSTDWTVYTSVGRLKVCQEPMLLDFSIYADIESENHMTKIFTCAAKNESTDVSNSASRAAHHVRGHHGISHERVYRRETRATCATGTKQTVSMNLNMDSTPGSATLDDLHSLINYVESHLVNVAHCDTTIFFGYYRGVAVGVYSGHAIDNVGSASTLIQTFRKEVPQSQSPKSIAVERCTDVPNSDYIFGVAIDTTGDLATVQSLVKSWNNAECAASSGKSTKVLKGSTVLQRALDFDFMRNSTIHTRELNAETATCRTTSVAHGDSCASLAKKCGISPADFTKYNPEKNMCSSLMPGQPVCCSAGSLPDIRPKPNSDGSCATTTIHANDTCTQIAAANELSVSDIESFNDGTTWGWVGCGDLSRGLQICLSTGDPPMPAWVSNAECGPTVNGTQRPTNGTSLAELNPCPLNACCDIWGQCGITTGYCTNVTGPTGNPGTAPAHQNGCISNCGTKITKSAYAPSTFTKIGYYESWNWDRPCLNLRAADVGVDIYTHVHWAFASITDDFDVQINDTYNQWQGFLDLYGVNRILSFGGWGYSTSPATYDQLRKAMDPANVDTFVQNIYNFVVKNGLDGIDFDWEYPGAPDIRGIPPGMTSDGPNYLNFLKKMRTNFPIEKTVSIAAPASYWYLKAFPIKEMAETLDYIVYMTYDLHGQWDDGNAWSQEGCKTGNCLYSQVNLTETEYALAMITKAGVDTNKVFVGIPTYGRSYGMADQSCTDPSCHFTGTNEHSTAAEGRCTKTAGIIANAEIYEILALQEQNTTYFDKGSDSNVIVWNDTWAAFMDDNTKASRENYYKGFNFVGTAEWAIDLAQFSGDDGDPGGEWNEPQPPTLANCTATYANVEALGADSDSIPQHCVAQYTVQTLGTLLTGAMKNYTDMMNNGYDEKFKIYAQAVAGNAGASVHDFVYANGTNYFSCQVMEITTCCSYCKSKDNQVATNDNCDYCWTDGDCYKPCTGLDCGHGNGMQSVVSKVINETEPCPPDYSKRGSAGSIGGDHEESVIWSLEDDKADKFYADIFASTGINKKHIKFGNYDRGNDCTPADHMGDGNECWALGYDYNIPLPNRYDASDVSNPKTTAQKGLDRSGNLTPQISEALFKINTDTWIGDGMDLVDAISMPILMIAQAVEEMSTVVSVANQITKAEEEAIIAGFLGALLFMVPIAGEVLGTVEELADVGAVLTLAGDAANIAEGVSQIVKDPSNAPLAIMNLIFVPGALSDAAKIAKAAKARRGMKVEDVAKLGDKVSGHLDSIKKVTGKCYS